MIRIEGDQELNVSLTLPLRYAAEDPIGTQLKPTDEAFFREKADQLVDVTLSQTPLDDIQSSVPRKDFIYVGNDLYFRGARVFIQPAEHFSSDEYTVLDGAPLSSFGKLYLRKQDRRLYYFTPDGLPSSAVSARENKNDLHAASAFTFKNPKHQALYDRWIAPFAELLFVLLSAYGLIHTLGHGSPGIAIVAAGPLGYVMLWTLHRLFNPAALEGEGSRSVYAMMRDSAWFAASFASALAAPSGMPALWIPLIGITALGAADLLFKHANLNRNGVYARRVTVAA